MSAGRSALGSIERILRDDASAPRLAMATLVSASGSTPKKAGAKMLLDATGAVSGTVTIGGCVDGRVLAAAGAILTSDAPAELLDIALGEDEAWELGLTCGGAVSVLVEPVTARVRDAYREVQRELAAGRPAVVATGLTPRTLRAVISRELTGDGGGAGGPLASAAKRALAAGLSVRVAAADLGADNDVFLEVFAPPTQVVIVGAGEIARSLVPLAHEMGMETVVIDARERFATRDRFPLAQQVKVGIPSELVTALPLSRRSAVVLVAHDYKYEIPVLKQALVSDAGYIGLLGGKRRGATIRQMLANDGITAAALDRIQSPIGLDIGARSTAEIALSIVAQLIARERPTA
jgi:xanthine dehydrogenase accessory factor